MAATTPRYEIHVKFFNPQLGEYWVPYGIPGETPFRGDKLQAMELIEGFKRRNPTKEYKAVKVD